MALALVATTTNSSVATTAVTVALPSGATGDLCVVIINRNSETVTTVDNNGATPFTEQIDSVQYGGVGGGSFSVYSRVLTGTEAGPLKFTISSANRYAVIAFVVSGEDTTTPFDTAFADGADESSTAPTCPTVTTNTDGAMAIAVAGTDGTGNGTFSAVPGTYTEIAKVNLQQPLSAAYAIISPAGATGAQDFTTTGGNNGTLTIFAIKPASGAAQVYPRRMLMMGVT